MDLHQDTNVQIDGPVMPQTPDNKPAKKGKLAVFLAGLFGVVAGVALVLVVLFATGFMKPSVITGPIGNSPSITINAKDENATVAQAVAAKVLPSVVSIDVVKPDGQAVGSGVIIDKDGDVLTNYHVVAKAQSISVSIKNNSYDAKLVGSDPSSDLAVIKVNLDGAKVTPIEMGDSANLKVGEWVMSVGSPYGLDQSVSTGIISSLYRNTMLPSVSGNTIYTNLIQTDAAMNPGNSGGALVNDKGQLIGINSIIESASGSSAGVGFAIPSNYAIEVANTIIAGKQVLHPYIGLNLQTVTAQNAHAAKLSVSQGAYVASVISGSPAEAAGLQKGDVITAVNGEPITSADALILSIRSYKIGDKVKVSFVRGSEQKEVEVTLGSDESLQKSQDQATNNFNLKDLFN